MRGQPTHQTGCRQKARPLVPKANTSPYPYLSLHYSISIPLFPELALSVGIGCRSCTVESFNVNVLRRESGMKGMLHIALPLYRLICVINILLCYEYINNFTASAIRFGIFWVTAHVASLPRECCLIHVNKPNMKTTWHINMIVALFIQSREAMLSQLQSTRKLDTFTVVMLCYFELHILHIRAGFCTVLFSTVISAVCAIFVLINGWYASCFRSVRSRAGCAVACHTQRQNSWNMYQSLHYLGVFTQA